MTSPKPLEYKIGNQTKSGKTIAFVFGCSADVIVYSDNQGETQWETNSDALTPSQFRAHAEFDRLNAIARANVGESRRCLLKDELASALFLGMCAASPEEAIKCFSSVDTNIRSEALIRARYHYLGYSTIATFFIVCGTLGVWLYSPSAATSLISLGGGCAAVGAWASVLQRTSRLALRPYDPWHYLASQGVTRILLGAMFGAFFVGATKAGLFLSVAANNEWALASLSFVSGFSERYIPELIRGLETELKSGKES